MITFSTSWPHATLWQNSTAHWSKKAPHKKAARREAGAEALGAGAIGLRGHDAYVVFAKFTPPLRRGRTPDRQNMPGAIKPHIDGIADALQCDDSCFHPRFDYTSKEGAGQVEFQVIPYMGEIE